MTPEEIQNYEPGYIFKNKKTDFIYTRMTLKQLFSRAKAIKVSHLEDYKRNICLNLEAIKKFHYIEGKRHSNQCRYAKGNKKCECWCQGKYHGMGDKLDQR